jgi:tetratricopeptide (TPR) repeat protein
LREAVGQASLNWSLTPTPIMKRLALYGVIALTAVWLTSSLNAQPNVEANKVARAAGDAAKNQDWDAAIDGFRKAAGMDHKYVPNLVAALQQRATNATKQNSFPDALNDLSEAIKIHPNPAAFELRAFVYGRMNDTDHALADYSEAIKMNPNEARLYSYRAHILAGKNDLKGAAADTDKVLKLKKNDPDATALKQWIDGRIKAQAEQGPNPPPANPR